MEKRTELFVQPFLKTEVTGYRELMMERPIRALFYEFTVNAREESPAGWRSLSYIPGAGGDILFIEKENRRLVELVGIFTQGRPIMAFCSAHYFGVRLYPGMKVSYQGVCPGALVNEARFFSGMEGKAADFFTQMAQVKQTERENALLCCAKLFCRYFGKKEPKQAEDDVTDRMLEEISRSRGMMRIQELAQKTHYSERQLCRIFEKRIGISPKAFARMIRFQYVVLAILYNPGCSLIEYLSELGYADQAHFQREFKGYMGITPGYFQKMVRER